MFRQYVNQGDINPASSSTTSFAAATQSKKRRTGAQPRRADHRLRRHRALHLCADQIEGVPIKSLVEFDEKFYDSAQQCDECMKGAPEELVRSELQ